MNPYLAIAIVGGAMELIGFLFAVINMANGANKMLKGDTGAFGSMFKRHLVSIAFCGIGGFLLLGSAIGFAISKLF